MVADGVGGWGELDVDPGKVSKYICKKIGQLYNSN